MSKIIEALGKLLPEDQVKDIAAAVEESLTEAKADLEKEFNTKLEEAYEQLSTELKDAEKVAESGYQEAYGVITDLRNRLETQRHEFDSALEEGYEEAYQMLLAERGKKESLEAELYEEYDKKLEEMKEYMVDKIDQFLQFKGQEIYEQARKDVLNDPALAEHRVTLNKVVETVSDYISNEDFAIATSSKLEEANKALEELRGQLKIVEARNIRISTENNKLNESLRHTQQLIKENTENSANAEKKERIEKAQNVSGRGKQVTENVEVIKETPTKATNKTDEKDNTLVENIGEENLNQWRSLAGINTASK